MPRLIKFRRKYFLMCADDFITLRLAMHAYRSHPLIGDANPFFEASICRLLIVNRVDFIESLLEFGQQLDKEEILVKYFPSDRYGRKVRNRERVELLKQAFLSAGFSIDDVIFSKYLAMKLLRVFIVHGNLDPGEESFIEEQGFEANLENLNLKHANEVIRVSSEFITYVLELKQKEGNGDRSEELTRLMQDIDLLRATGFDLQGLDCRIDDDLGLVKKSDVALMFWNNLGKISEQLEKPNLDRDEIEKLGSTAVESWNEFWRLTFSSNFIEVSDLEKAVEFYKRYQDDDFGDLSESEEEVNTASIVGNEARKSVPNVTAVSLFLKQLPEVDPKQKDQYHASGRQALVAWEAAYYGRKHPTDGSDFDYDHLESYRKLLRTE